MRHYPITLTIAASTPYPTVSPTYSYCYYYDHCNSCATSMTTNAAPLPRCAQARCRPPCCVLGLCRESTGNSAPPVRPPRWQEEEV